MYVGSLRKCPACGVAAHRTRRRILDRVVSLIVLQHRYRCGAIGCTWEGRLQVNSGHSVRPVDRDVGGVYPAGKRKSSALSPTRLIQAVTAALAGSVISN